MTQHGHNIRNSDGNQPNKQPVYLNTGQSAEYITKCGLRITKGQLANLRHFDRGPAYIKFNGYIYYTAEDLDAWLTKEVRRISPEG